MHFKTAVVCPKECFDGALLYMRIYLAATPASLLYNYGSYYSNIPANIQDNIPEYISVITLMRDNRISVNGVLYTYTVDIDSRQIIFGNSEYITLSLNKFNYKDYDYVYIENQ